MQIVFSLPKGDYDRFRLCCAIEELQRPTGKDFSKTEFEFAERMFNTEAWYAIWYGGFYPERKYHFFSEGAVICLPSTLSHQHFISYFGTSG